MATLTDTNPQIDPVQSILLQTESQRSTPLDEAVLRRLCAYMLKCRMVEERIRLLYRQGRFAGNYFAAVGQEATEVGGHPRPVAGGHDCTFSSEFRGTHHEGHAVEFDVCLYLWTRD